MTKAIDLPVTPILLFYRGRGGDHRGRTLAQILTWSDDDLEGKHDFIQWLFPLDVPSRVSIHAPIFGEIEARSFRGEGLLRENMYLSFARMLDFMGLREEGDGSVREGVLFAQKSSVWLGAGNHNHLRITRIIRSLRLAGMSAQAGALFGLLREFRKERSTRDISEESFRYWEDAALGRLPAWAGG